ncbi:MAG: hypothetical protein ACTSUD_13230 [Alphaproteobacteria bacterium]
MSWAELVSILGIVMVVLGLNGKFTAAVFGEGKSVGRGKAALIGAGVIVFAVSAYFVLDEIGIWAP